MTPKPSRIVRKGETVTAKGPDAHWYIDMMGLNEYNTRGLPSGVQQDHPKYQRTRPAKSRHWRTKDAHRAWYGPNRTW